MDRQTRRSSSTLSAVFYFGIGALILLIVLSAVTLGVVLSNNSENTPGEPYIRRQCCFTAECATQEDMSDCEVDIVIAGCGSAGSLMASQLSQLRYGERNYSVLCLEKGGYYNDEIAVNRILENGTFWMFVPVFLAKYAINTLSDPDTEKLRGFLFNIQHGSMVGGSGNVDYSLIVYPSPNTTKAWVAAAGAAGAQWDYEAVVSYITKYEQFLGNPGVCPHGSDGRIANLPAPSNTDASFVSYQLMQAIVAASPGDNGIAQLVDDQNCGSETSYANVMQYFWRPLSQSVIARSSPGLEYLGLDVMNAQGFGVGGRRLRVLTGTVVDKFHVNPGTNRADYVEATVNGRTRRFYARKQIISALSGIYSPGFLERSGVGNSAILSSLGIPVVHHSPEVGENLQQHLGSQFVFTTNQKMDNFNFVSSQGLLSMLPGLGNSRDVQLLVIPGGGFNIYNGHGVPTAPLPEGFSSVSLLLSILAPRSRGSIHINTREPSRWPTVIPNSYTDAENIDFRLINQTLTSVYQAIVALRIANPQFSYQLTVPPESVFASANALSEYIYNFPMNQAHWSSTCSMGSVIDGNLKLNGVDGVTVADTSSLSVINSGNTRTQALITGAYAVEHLLATM